MTTKVRTPTVDPSSIASDVAESEIAKTTHSETSGVTAETEATVNSKKKTGVVVDINAINAAFQFQQKRKNRNHRNDDMSNLDVNGIFLDYSMLFGRDIVQVGKDILGSGKIGATTKGLASVPYVPIGGNPLRGRLEKDARSVENQIFMVLKSMYLEDLKSVANEESFLEELCPDPKK